MLEIQRIRNEKESVLRGLKKRNIDASQTIDKVLLIDQEWENQSEMCERRKANTVGICTDVSRC